MTGPALLRTIIANPQDDAPRLVYADWLQENGREWLAEFIRASIDYEPYREKHGDERPEGDGRAAELFDRLDRMWRARAWEEFDPPWLQPVPGQPYPLGTAGVNRPRLIGVRRGFASMFHGSAADWLRLGDALSWSPEQTVPCPTCKGSQYVRAKPCRTCCPDGAKALVGPSTVPRPVPPTAMPVTEVRLTTQPDMIPWSRETRDMPFNAAAVVWFRQKWPAVKVWHLPPEPWTAEDGARAVNGDPDAPLPLGVMDVETTDWDSAASLSAAPPDNARRRAGHSRMPEWLSARRGQRPTQRPSRR